MEVSVQPANGAAELIRRGVVSDAEAEGNDVAYRFTDGGRILVSKFRAAHISPGDEIAWSLPLAPFLHAWPAAIRQAKDASRHDVRELFAQRGEPSQQIRDSRALRIVALWWWVLPIAHIPRWFGFIVSAVLVSAALLVLVRSAPSPA